MTAAGRRLAAVPLWATALSLYGGIAVLMWLPFGFRTNGLVEEWDIMWLLDRGEQLWWITGSSAVAFLRLRPLSMAPEALAHALGGFIWLNVLTLVALALKGLATFQLVDRLAPGRRPAAWIAGGLAMLYPVNTGLFTMRMTHVDIAITLFLYALVLLCDIARRPRWWRVILMWLLLAASLLMYQIALLATLVGPVALVLLGVRAWRRLSVLSATWFAALAAVAVYWLVIASQGGAYELDSAKGQRLPFRVYAHDFAESYVDQLVRGWHPTAWVTWAPRYIVLATICGAVVAAAAFIARNDGGRLRDRSSLLGGVGVIAVAPLGFLPFWAIVAAIHVTLKVYLLSSVAVAAGVALLVGFVLRRTAFVAVCGGFLVGLSALYGLHQHAHYVSLADRQARVLGEMVQQLPSPPDGTTIVVHDRSGQLGMEWTGGPPVTFAAAVSVAYHNPTLRVALCDDITRHAYLNGGPLARCPVTGVVANAAASPAPLLAVFDYDLVHELRLVTHPTGALPKRYAPLQLAGHGPPIRRSLFPCLPVQRCTRPPSASFPQGSIDERFDNDTLNATGMRASELAPDGTPFRWMNAPVLHVYANLPAQRARLRLQIIYVLDANVLSSIQLRVNGVNVPTTTTQESSRNVVTATIPGAALRAPLDDLAISSDTVPVAGSLDKLGLAVTRLEVAPSTIP